MKNNDSLVGPIIFAISVAVGAGAVHFWNKRNKRIDDSIRAHMLETEEKKKSNIIKTSIKGLELTEKFLEAINRPWDEDMLKKAPE